MSTELQERSISTFARLEPGANGPQWLQELRERAKASFERQGVPDMKHEEWKYTNLRDLKERGFVLATPAIASPADLAEYAYSEKCHRIVLVNGIVDSSLTSADAPGLTVATLSSDYPLIQHHLGQLVELDAHPFAALNSAHFQDCVLVHIAKSAAIEWPIELLHLTASDGRESVSFPRILVIAEESSEATLVETYASAGNGTTLTCGVTEVFVAANAKLEHVKAQRESLDSFHIALTQARQERDSTYRHFSVTYGGKLTRNDLNTFLNGSNLHCRLDGVYVQNGEQVCDNHTRLDHAFPHCDSFEVYKGVLDGHARGVFNGKIYVHLDAQKTDAKQTNQAILLSPTASIDTKPQLEIYADDVKCTHGATVGQLREEALFYLRSRGIPLAEARALLVYAFAAEVLEKIEAVEVRAKLESLLYQKLSGSPLPSIGVLTRSLISSCPGGAGPRRQSAEGQIVSHPQRS
jgi:Fe-S cluster assembly protein SufD